MKLPELDDPARYVGLYVVDFGGDAGCAVGYTAEEVAALLESERFAAAQVYRIHDARPDGALALAGVARARFTLESGMFFHALGADDAQTGYETLRQWAERQPPPCRTQLHLARDAEGRRLVALIYPAEYEEDMGAWLAASGYRGRGPVDAGASQVTRYHSGGYEVTARAQLWPADPLAARDTATLLAAVGDAVQR